MSSAMISQTLQGAALSVVANVLGQLLSSYKANTPYTLNLTQVLKFVIFSIYSNPPNIVWQNFLENNFPTTIHTPVAKSQPNEKPTSTQPTEARTSKRNVLVKFLLDQTFGAVMNNLMFLVFMAYINASPSEKGGPWGAVQREVRDKMWPMMLDGYKVWPVFSLVSFLWIPVDKRVVAGCLVGIGWGIYLSLMVDA